MKLCCVVTLVSGHWGLPHKSYHKSLPMILFGSPLSFLCPPLGEAFGLVRLAQVGRQGQPRADLRQQHQRAGTPNGFPEVVWGQCSAGSPVPFDVLPTKVACAPIGLLETTPPQKLSSACYRAFFKGRAEWVPSRLGFPLFSAQSAKIYFGPQT